MKPEWCTQEVWDKADHLFRCSSADVIALALMRAERRGMEKAAGLIDHGFDKLVGEPYRADGTPSKNDKCPHGRYMYEDCEQCCSAAIRAKAQEATR